MQCLKYIQDGIGNQLLVSNGIRMVDLTSQSSAAACSGVSASRQASADRNNHISSRGLDVTVFFDVKRVVDISSVAQVVSRFASRPECVLLVVLTNLTDTWECFHGQAAVGIKQAHFSSPTESFSWIRKYLGGP